MAQPNLTERKIILPPVYLINRQWPSRRTCCTFEPQRSEYKQEFILLLCGYHGFKAHKLKVEYAIFHDHVFMQQQFRTSIKYGVGSHHAWFHCNDPIDHVHSRMGGISQNSFFIRPYSPPPQVKQQRISRFYI